MTTSTGRRLFAPMQICATTPKHRVVMAPLTRSRSAQPGDIPGDLMLEYYGQRASDGGLIISEATSISISGRGWYSGSLENNTPTSFEHFVQDVFAAAYHRKAPTAWAVDVDSHFHVDYHLKQFAV